MKMLNRSERISRFSITREELRKKIAAFLKNGGKIKKIEIIEPCKTYGDYRPIDPVLCGCGGVIPRDYPEDYFL